MLRKIGALTALALAAATPVAAQESQEHLVMLLAEGYFPDAVYPQVGDTVLFVNSSSFPMSATAEDGSWDSGVLQQNEQFSLIITDGMTMGFTNSVTDNVDEYGQQVGVGVLGLIDYSQPAPLEDNSSL